MSILANRIPKSETIWKTEHTPSGTFYTTSNNTRSKYTLWQQTADGFAKVKTATTPDKFNTTMDSYWNPTSDDKPKRKRRV